MNIAVVGTGHVGLITCVTMAEKGHRVIGTDVDPDKLQRLNAGEAPFYEPDLQETLTRELSKGSVRFVADMAEAVGDAAVVFICVGTPQRATGEANLAAVEESVSRAARHAPSGTVIAEKSTVPAGTARRLREVVKRSRPDPDVTIEIASNPEFLREGRAMADARKPDRILVGTDTEAARQTMRDVYEPWTAAGCPLVETGIDTAELAKHACNAFLALKISFANALARICERAGADVTAIADVMGMDERIGRAFLNAGLGFGGSCFPKDLKAFDRLAAELGYEFPLLREVQRINDEAVDATFRKVAEALWNLEGKKVALLGLAFKPGTDDVRFAPPLALARRLVDAGAAVSGYDPEAGGPALREVPELEIAADPYECAAGADCVVACTEWDEIARIDLVRLGKAMAVPILVDARNLFDGTSALDAGFTYYPTGRPAPVIA